MNFRSGNGGRTLTFQKQCKMAQLFSGMMMPKVPFARLVLELGQQYVKEGDDFGSRWQGEGLGALQAAAEAYLTTKMEHANSMAMQAKRQTIRCGDMITAGQLHEAPP
jgi:histone H3/H4